MKELADMDMLREPQISSLEEVKGKDMDMDMPGEAEVSGQEKPHKGSSISKDDEGLEIVPEGESCSAGRQGLKNVVHETKTTMEERLQEGGISASKDDHDWSMISNDEELVPDTVGNEQKYSAIQAYLSNDFANHHCFRSLISEDLGGSIDSLVNVQGIEDALSTIKRHLMNDEVGVIKILGVGGAGKTTLLRKLRADLNAKKVFDFKVVIMVTASKYFQHSMKIQKDIGEQLGLSLFACGPTFVQDKQASILHQALSERMPFLLLLDGAAEIEQDKIGIPQPDKQNGCKIIIATDVSKEMENAEIVKVSLLDQDESKKLFLGAVQGKLVIDSEQTEDHLAKLLDKCNGIPLAIILVGRAMAFNKEEQDWLGAINKLGDLAAKDLPGAEQSVRSAIKFSYDTLKDDTLRSCLSYCSLFPEHHNIGVEELIGYWYGEGLLQDDDIDGARRKGYVLIRQLKAASLLEVGRDRENEVRMHDVVRDVVLQLTSNSPGQSSTFIVPSGSETKQAPEDEKWRQATRVSLMYSEVEMVPSKIPKCPNLSSLLINNNLSLKQIPENFFKHMPALHVLDLSSTGIKKLPKAVGKLPVLRFLNLSKTCITSLPEELGNLSQLKQLNLSYMSSLSNIPRNAMLRLSKLQTLNLYGTTHWCIQQPGHGKQKRACIQDLESLVQLKDLRLTITTVSSLEKLQSCPNLLKSSRLLSLEQVQDLSLNLLSDISEKLENLQVLQISEASNLKGLQFHKHQFQSLGFLSLEHLSQATLRVEESTKQFPFQMLRHLHIVGCHGFEDISWACRLPFLECMELRVCYGVEVLTTDDVGVKEAVYSFPMLKKMLLLDLPVLERISLYPLSLPSLEYLEVCYCPKLKKLPLKSQSARKIKEIRGHKEWWDELEWDSICDKINFLRLFKELRNHEQMTGQI